MPNYRRRAMKGRQRRKKVGRSQFGRYGRKIKQPVHYFTRTAFSPNFTQAVTTTASGNAINFQLGFIPSPTDFTTLYDQYKILAIKMQLVPRFTNAIVATGGTNQILGNIWSVIDYDDTNTPTAVTELLQYQNCKRTRMDKIHTRYIKPRYNPPVTGGQVVQTPTRNEWIDIANANVPHNGIKFWFDQIAGPAGTQLSFDLIVKYYFCCKNVR